ncbi:MAG: polyhydroxyalkanoic acid system family protein [Myxococcales bacterium]|nr:polyhydroxyalkanoic acid system family protein [Myxococcales bacterium]
MKHSVTHDLDDATAKRATEKAFAAYAERFEKYSPRAHWTHERHCDVTFSVKGFTLRGALDLEPGQIVMDLEVPFVLRVFKGQALDIIEREIRLWVDKAKRGELDD